jgi:hypothetical protein
MLGMYSVVLNILSHVRRIVLESYVCLVRTDDVS